MPRRFHNCRGIITGASGGIGRELALELSRQGARVLLAARRAAALDELAAECRRLGAADAAGAPGDITDASYRTALADQAAERWGGLDLLVNNAGVSAHAAFGQSDAATLRQIMEVNFFAAAELTRAALPLLAAGERPAIVNIGSILGHRGLPFNSEYSASKFALRGWSEALRAELAPQGVHVLLISPGTTDTEFFEHLLARNAPLPWGRSKAVSPAAVARQTVRAIRRRRGEAFPNWRGHALVLANRAAPRLVDRLLAKIAGGSHNESGRP